MSAAPFRVGLLGAGHISATYARALREVAGAELVAVWSRTRESAERFAEREGLALGSSDPGVVIEASDVVCVNSINALHAEHAIRAARAGRHVIVEKPLAVSLGQARDMIAACEEAGVGLGYAEELCFVPKFVRAKEIAASGDLGDILHVHQRESHGGPYSPWFFTRDEAGGGVLMDMACHGIELVRWLLGKPTALALSAEIRCTGLVHETELDDHSITNLSFEGGVTATCEASWILQGGMQSRLEVWGTKGHLEVDLLGGTGIRVFTPKGSASAFTGPGWGTTSPSWLHDNGYPQELEHFLACFRSGATPEESGADGLAVLEILHAAYASARRGERIALPFRPEGVERAVDLWL